MKKVKSKLSTFMQNFIATCLLILLTLLLCFTTNPFEKPQPKTIDAVSIIPDSTTMYEWQQDDRCWYTYLGTYPQTYVGDELNTQLFSLLESGDLDAAATGNTYISNNRASEEEFYEEVLRALWGYLSDKLNIPPADLTKDNIEAELTKYGVDEALMKEFMDILNTCEFARYAPSQASDAMDKLYSLTVDAIGKMENTIKK